MTKEEYEDFYEKTCHYLSRLEKRISSLETEVFPKEDAKEDAKEDEKEVKWEETVDQQIKNLQVLYSGIEEKYINLRERIDDLETRVYTPTEGEVKRDVKKDKPKVYTKSFTTFSGDIIKLTGTVAQHQSLDRILESYQDMDLKKFVVLALDCGLMTAMTKIPNELVGISAKFFR